jgi:hypothetical protein
MKVFQRKFPLLDILRFQRIKNNKVLTINPSLLVSLQYA